MKTITIHSEGHGNTTKIINEDGTVLEDVKSVHIELEAGQFNTCEIILQGASTAIKAVVGEVQVTCPACFEVVDHECEKLQ